MAPVFLLVPVPALTGVVATATSPMIQTTSALSPPAWVYSIVWSFLYVLLGLSWALQADRSRESFALHTALVATLTLWTPVYTRLSRELALLVTAGAIPLTVLLLAAHGAWLLVPLAAWLSFALVINVDQVRLDRS